VKRLVIGIGLAASFAVFGQNALPDWVLRLSRVKLHLKDNFERIPNYVCREDVDRYRKPVGRLRSVHVDSVHLEVAEVDHKELLARPDAAGFEDRDLSSFVSTGVLGRGQFASQPTNLFVWDRARITPHNQASKQPPAGEGWDYEIPAFLRGYEILNLGKRVSVGVQGTFWVDQESMDLVRIDERVVDPPLASGMRASSTIVEYARMQIGTSSVLLPQAAELIVVNLDGEEWRNAIKFSGCREYTSESTVRFGDPVEPPQAGKKK